eukprot:scaffold2850_cov235-Pinguiococcus_pyrenoidosus.AAC.19
MVVGIVVHHPIGVSVPIPQAQPRGPRSAEALPESKRHDSVAAELHLQRRERRVHEDARIPNIRVLVGVRHGVSNALPGLDDLLVVLRVSLVVLVPEALRQLHPQALERRKVASQLDLETHVVPRERRAVGSSRPRSLAPGLRTAGTAPASPANPSGIGRSPAARTCLPGPRRPGIPRGPGRPGSRSPSSDPWSR